MKRAFVVPLLLVVLAGCFSSRKTPQATQENFGVNMARMNLWREALFRFKRAVQMNPTDAMAHNNLAVAYEANGDFDNAAKEYREAMRLDKTNTYIQKNYSRYVEFTTRNKKRQKKDAPKTAAAAPATTAVTSEGGTASAPAPAGAPPATTPPPVVPAAATGDGPGSTAQPTGTAPAAIPPAATAPPPPAPPQKPPGDHS